MSVMKLAIKATLKELCHPINSGSYKKYTETALSG